MTLTSPVYVHSLGVCILCNSLFSTDIESVRYPVWDNGYDGLVCCGCVRNKLRNRVKDYAKRARAHKTYSKLSRREVFQVIYLSDMSCVYCKTICDCSGTSSSDTSKLLTIDHVYPLSLGGMNVAHNLAVLCEACHKDKDHRRLVRKKSKPQGVKRGKDVQEKWEKKARKDRRRKARKAAKRHEQWMEYQKHHV